MKPLYIYLLTKEVIWNIANCFLPIANYIRIK